jgi:DNA-binding NarL/FixJ family response regulator
MSDHLWHRFFENSEFLLNRLHKPSCAKKTFVESGICLAISLESLQIPTFAMNRDWIELRVLIADTATMYADSLCMFLSGNARAGFIEVANNKQELIESMDDARHDLLIIEPACVHGDFSATDIEFLYAFRTRYPHQPIVVFTSERSPRALQKIAQLERIGVASKRDDLSDLLGVCERVIAGEKCALSWTIVRILNLLQ